MKWKGRPQSKNVEDRQLEDFTPEEGELVLGGIFGNGPKNNEPYSKDIPNAKKWNDGVRTAKEVARKGNNVPTPTPRPDNGKTHDNLVTPGKWTTKSKKK